MTSQQVWVLMCEWSLMAAARTRPQMVHLWDSEVMSTPAFLLSLFSCRSEMCWRSKLDIPTAQKLHSEWSWVVVSQVSGSMLHRERKVKRVPVYWLGLRQGTFTCVRWQVILCDPIWQVTPRSSRMTSCRGLYSAWTFALYKQQFTSINQKISSTMHSLWHIYCHWLLLHVF